MYSHMLARIDRCVRRYTQGSETISIGSNPIEPIRQHDHLGDSRVIHADKYCSVW